MQTGLEIGFLLEKLAWQCHSQCGTVKSLMYRLYNRLGHCSMLFNIVQSLDRESNIFRVCPLNVLLAFKAKKSFSTYETRPSHKCNYVVGQT